MSIKWTNLYEFSPRVRRIASRLIPRVLRSVLRVLYVFFFQLGHLRSVRTRRVEWPGEGPVPWFTYAAIEYLRQFDYSGKNIFEFGSGFSSIFWNSRGAYVTTVEHDERWYIWLKTRIPANINIIHAADVITYTQSIEEAESDQDVIIIDGSWREECATKAVSRLRRGGIIILDNSDWFPHVAKALREANLLQVDFHDFSPGVDFRSTTSIFFSRDFRFACLSGRQPSPPVGGMPHEETWRIWPHGQKGSSAAPP